MLIWEILYYVSFLLKPHKNILKMDEMMIMLTGKEDQIQTQNCRLGKVTCITILTYSCSEGCSVYHYSSSSHKDNVMKWPLAKDNNVHGRWDSIEGEMDGTGEQRKEAPTKVERVPSGRSRSFSKTPGVSEDGIWGSKGRRKRAESMGEVIIHWRNLCSCLPLPFSVSNFN
jgi:hypothetical protein